MKTIKELMDIRGRVALVVGAAGNIGRVACESLAELGASIVLVDLDADTTEKVSNYIEERFSVEVLHLSVDLRSEESINLVPTRILETFGRLDILINSAGVVGTSKRSGWITPFLEQESGPW